ncbi:MAG: GNAT family N-acetyltransferase [Gemmatimonadales bacterium]
MPPVGASVFATPRLRIRRWRRDDLPLARQLWGDPEVTRFIDARSTLPPEAILERLDTEIATEAGSGVQYWPLFLRETGEFVGCAGLRPRPPAGSPNRPALVYELGFHLRPTFRGRGLALEAAHAAARQAFDILGATALFAGHHPDNERSRLLLERLGFRFTHRERYPPTGLDHPSYRCEPTDLVNAGPVLRAMRAADWPAVKSIYEAGLAEQAPTYRNVHPDRDAWVHAHPGPQLVATLAGAVVGWAALGRLPAATDADPAAAVYVAEAYRGRGLGALLLDELLAAARDAGLVPVFASVFTNNAASLRLLDRAGFRRFRTEPRPPDFNGNWLETELRVWRAETPATPAP